MIQINIYILSVSKKNSIDDNVEQFLWIAVDVRGTR